jgi:glycosyltransferase involved in cell wall biosynthesis
MVFIVGPLTSQHIQQWYKKFNDQVLNMPVHVFTVHPGGESLPDNFIIHSAKITGSRLDFLFLMPVLLCFFLLKRPKIVNFHFVSSYGLLALLLPKHNSAFFLHTWGSDVNMTYDAMPGLKCRLASKALKKMDWINAPANHIKRKLVAIGAAEEKIDVYQYGVDVDFIRRLVREKQALPLVFVSNRNWQAIYRIPALVEAFLEWQTRTPKHAELWLFGSGSDADRAAVTDVIKRYDPEVQSKIKIMGYTPKHEMLEKIAAAHFFVSIPTRDGSPVSLLEAMLLRLYPIVSDIDANKEILSDKTALFWQAEDNRHLVSLFEKAVEMDISSALEENVEHVVTTADINVNLSRFYTLFKSVRLP